MCHIVVFYHIIIHWLWGRNNIRPRKEMEKDLSGIKGHIVFTKWWKNISYNIKLIKTSNTRDVELKNIEQCMDNFPIFICLCSISHLFFFFYSSFSVRCIFFYSFSFFHVVWCVYLFVYWNSSSFLFYL